MEVGTKTDAGMTPLAPYIKSHEWHANRCRGLGGSDANVLASGDPDKIHDLWILKTGRREPEPLLNLPVLLGVVTEDLNVAWFSHVTGRRVWDAGGERIHEAYPWMRASLDGVTTAADGREALLECKTVNAWSKMPVLLERYRPQLHHSMAAGGWDVSVLSAIIGNRHYHEEVELDPWYLMDLIDLEQEFWACVTEGREPGPNIMRGIG